MIISTILEFTAAILLVIGFINEKKVIAFENRVFEAISKKFK